MAEDKKVSASQAASEAKSTVEATNTDVEKATAEAAKRVPGKERFVTVDAVLANDEHYANIREAQAQTNGIDYDPKTDPENVEYVAPEVAPVASLNQNNLKHPASDEYVDPHMSKNYLGQPL